MSSKKSQEIDKTLVVDFKVQVVDMALRLTALAGAHSVAIKDHGNISQSDYTVTKTERAFLKNIKRVVVIESWGDILLTISNGSGEVYDVPCTGLFVFFGELNEISICAPDDVTPVRVRFIYS